MSRFFNYELTLETIGPLYVGSGETIGKSEYVIFGNKVYIFDMKKMFSGITKYHLENKYSQSVLNEKNFNLSYFFRSNNIAPETYKKWAKYCYNIPENTDLRAAKNILAHVKDAYSKPYVPGSSLKGALRNIILNGLLLKGENKKFDSKIEIDLKNHIGRNGKPIKRAKYLSQDSNELDEKMFNILNRPKTKPYDAVNSIFQGIIISDSQPLDTDSLILCPKIDVLPKNKGENPLKNVVRECIKPGTKISFSLQIDRRIFPYNINDIMDFISETYKNLNKKFLSDFPTTVTTSDKYKIYLGGGTGYQKPVLILYLMKEIVQSKMQEKFLTM